MVSVSNVFVSSRMVGNVELIGKAQNPAGSDASRILRFFNFRKYS